MRMSSRCPTGLLVLLGVLILSGPPAQGAVLQSGIHGMVWGGQASDYPYLEKVREEGPAAYYLNRNIAYHAVGQPVSAVIYGFYRDQLFAAYIKLNSPNQAYYLEKHFNAEYGPAKITTAGDQTVYRWEDQDLKIKLKINDANNEIKLGLYYEPLATELNQVLVEEGPTDLVSPSPSKGKPAESAPLL